MHSEGLQSSLLMDDLREEIRKKRAVVLVGAGVSLASTDGNDLAAWKGLLLSGCERCEGVVNGLPQGWGMRVRQEIESGDLVDLLSAAEKVSSKLTTQKGEYARWLSDTVGSLHPLKTETIAALASIGAPILTTNYDSLIEEVTGLPSITWRDATGVERFVRGDTSGVFHLHGHWKDPDSVILGIRSYERILANSLTQASLQALRATKTFVFVGFGGGLNDPNLSALLAWARAAFPNSPYRHFRLVCERDRISCLTQHDAGDQNCLIFYGHDYGQLVPFLRNILIAPGGVPQPESEHPIKAKYDEQRSIVGPSPESKGAQLLDLGRPIRVTKFRKQEKIDATIIANVAFHPEGHLMAFSLDNRLFVLPLHDVFPERLGVHEDKRHPKNGGPFLPTGNEELPASKRGEAHFVRITDIAFSPDGELVASSDTDGYVKFWSLASRECVAELSEHTDVVTSIAFSPKGDLFASASYDERIDVWKTDAKFEGHCSPYREFRKKSNIKRAPRFQHDLEQIVSMTFSQDGKHLASGDQQGVIVVREILSGEEIFREKVHTKMVNSIAFSPTRMGLLATASDDTRIRLTDCCRRHPPVTLGVKHDKHTDSIMSIAFSHTGDIIVSSAGDRKIKLWDVVGRRLLHTYPSEDDRPVQRVAFCPNRYDFATDSYDSNISLWGISNAGDITNTKIRVGRGR